MRDVKVIFSQDALKVYNLLKSSSVKNDLILSKSIEYKINLLKENPQFGDPISKNKIPIIYVNKYGINNLYRVKLPLFWRLLYTLRNGPKSTELIIFLISVTDHKEYNKIFKYK